MKEKCGAALTNEDVYMSTTYKDFLTITVLRSRGVSLKKPFTYDAVNSRHSIRVSSFHFLGILMCIHILILFVV